MEKKYNIDTNEANWEKEHAVKKWQKIFYKRSENM